MIYKKAMNELEKLASHDPKDLAGMARFGINVDKAWVISIPKLRTLAKKIKQDSVIARSETTQQSRDRRATARDGNPTSVIPAKAGIYTDKSLDPRDEHEDDKNLDRHELALELWDSEIHEARILAGFIDDPAKVTEEQLETWVLDFDSWDICDQVCSALFDKTDFAYQKAEEWSERPEEFVKRAGFVLMATLAVHDKKAPDAPFEKFLEICKREATDERNFVRKAVNWAIRSIGKSRNVNLYNKALQIAQEILKENAQGETLCRSKTARWIANDAISELEKDYIKKRFVQT